MATTVRDRTHNYDNIAKGSATGTERTVSGDVPPAQSWGNGTNIAVASDYGKENVVVAGTALLAGEDKGD